MDSNLKEKKIKLHYRATRKLSVASTYVTGNVFSIMINGKEIDNYFKSISLYKYLLDKLKNIIGDKYNFNYIIKLIGGGLRSQLDTTFSSICKLILDKCENEEEKKELKSSFKKNQLLITNSKRHIRHTAGKPGRNKSPVHKRR